MDAWILFIKMNYESILLVFAMSFCIGMVLALSTYFWNRERKKKGFRKCFFTSKEKRIDKKVTKEYRKEKWSNDMFLKDDMEHHANQKY